MNLIRSFLRSGAVSLVFAVFFSLSPESAGATEFNVPTPYRTIQDAISAATGSTSDVIVVEPGVYEGPITMKNNVSLRGMETARTFLSGGEGPVVTADGQISATIQNFTFVNASSGILVSNSSTLSIVNNVFEVGLGGTAITLQFSPSTRVINNTFFQNGTALTTDSDNQIFNNIFANNTTEIVGPFPGTKNIANNAFSLNNTISTSPTVSNLFVGNPLFVDPVNHDFHLREGSPCIDTGNASAGMDVIDGSTSDIGAYGGPSADTIPFPVAGLNITSSTDTSIEVAWLPNDCYLVTNTTNATGGYKVYYGYASGDYTCTLASCGTATSPITVGVSTSTTLTGLTSPSTPLSAPVLDQPSPRDSELVLSWTAVSGATGYKVHYGAASLDEHDLDVGNTTSYTLSGLTNGQYYSVAVSAYSRRTYYIAVTAYDNTLDAHESAYAEVSRQIGPASESALSNVLFEYPEPIVTYPALPDTGGRCFIATAAYGHTSAPEVRALRAFRDRYLMASAPGRMFVHWYYRHGPVAAALLNSHPGYKPMVRAALMPAVGMAIFLTGTSTIFKAGVFLFLGAAGALGFFRKRRAGTGGLR